MSTNNKVFQVLVPSGNKAIAAAGIVTGKQFAYRDWETISMFIRFNCFGE